ncbi:MAG TPA: PAS domain-containing protein [Candidatus Cybelea sp.]|nr:PAS domain-containing protein [Candidatus Cybelea sp.]
MQDWRTLCHPAILKVLAYWESKRHGRTMPRRSDIDPAELVELLPFIMLVDVVGDERRFVYRLVGTGEVEVRGRDPTGKAVAEAYFAASAHDALKNYQAVCDTHAPLYEEDNFQIVDRYVGEANLFLPLSDDDKTVNKIMVFSINRDLYRVT